MNQVEVKRKQIQLAACMLGLINVWIIGKSVGDSGIAYLAAAWEMSLVIGLLTGRKVPDVLGRMLRSRYAKGQYKNVSKMKRNVLLLQSLTGLLGSVLFFCLADFTAEKIFRIPYSRFLMMLLSPVILFTSISAVLMGYFQGEGSEMPSAVSSVLRQILFLGSALLFSRLLGGYGDKVSALLGQPAFTAMYGGIGVVLAILLTELLILLFLLLVYKGSSRADKSGLDGMKETDSFVGQVFGLYRNMGGRILLGILESLPLWLGLIFFQKSAVDVDASAAEYGVYAGKYLVLCGLPVLLTVGFVTGIIAKAAVRVRRQEYKFAKDMFQSGLRIAVIHSLFFAVYAAMLNKQLAGVFGGTSESVLGEMLVCGFLLIPFAALTYYFSRLLILLNKRFLIYACSGAGDIVFTIFCAVLLNTGEKGILALVYAGCIGAFVYALTAGVLTCRLLQSSIDWLHTLAIPAGCAGVIGLLCLLFGKTLTPQLGSGLTALLCFVFGGVVYWALLLLLRCFQKEELDAIPGGRILQNVGRLLHIWQ